MASLKRQNSEMALCNEGGWGRLGAGYERLSDELLRWNER